MELIVYGKVIKKHGLKGEVKILPYSGELQNFENLSRLFLLLDKEIPQEYKIKQRRYQKNLALVKLEGIDSPEEAEKLRGCTVLIDSNELPQTQEDEYYWFELIGLDVVTTDHKPVGKVISLLDTAAQPVLVVKNNKKEHMIPMVDKFVKKIDLEESIIIIEPIEGLID